MTKKGKNVKNLCFKGDGGRLFIGTWLFQKCTHGSKTKIYKSVTLAVIVNDENFINKKHLIRSLLPRKPLSLHNDFL